MNYVNDTFLIILQKSVIEVSLKYHRDALMAWFYMFFGAVWYRFWKLYKVRRFSALSFVSQIVK